ncbi:MAG: acetylglutamate kinase [Candidatus Firestonebacteria bacterium]
MKNLIKKVDILIEALPYIRQFKDKIFVIKYGGKAMVNESLKNSIIQDIILMKLVGISPIVVHGGGPEITRAMEKCGKKPKFVNGLRVTDKETMKIVETAMKKINKEIVSLFNEHGVKAIGLSPALERRGNLIVAKKYFAKDILNKKLDIGFVGEVKKINIAILKKFKEYIAVITPLGTGIDKNTYNINADDVASGLAIKLKAEKLILLTDVDGVYDKHCNLIPTIGLGRIQNLIKNKTIKGGMIPKVKSALKSIKAGVKKVHILNGNIKHSILLEIFTNKGIGTEIKKS